jgi:predicted nucleic acid-binding protein
MDASAIVKMCLDEDGHQEVRDFVNRESKPFYTTRLCIAEAFGVLKRKLVAEKALDDRAYYDAVNSLLRFVLNTLKIDQMDANRPDVFAEVRRVGLAHQLDFSDALQLVTLVKGTNSVLGPNSASVLITADKRLRDATRTEGGKVWYPGELMPG